MTDAGKHGKVKTVKIAGEIKSLVWIIGIVMLVLLFSADAKEYTLYGFRLAFFTVLPSAIPSMLLGDLYVAYGKPENLTLFGKAFCALFGISPVGLRAYVLGSLAGFPMGARAVADSYGAGTLTKSDAERLVGLSSIPSPSFIIGGVGLGMLGSLKTGIMLLLITHISNLLSGIICREKSDFTKLSTLDIRQNYSLVESIRGVGGSAVTISSFIISFSIIVGFIKKLIRHEGARLLILIFTEVTVGVDYISASAFSFEPVKYALIAFALSFGGVCISLQNAAMLSGKGLAMLPYFKLRLVAALIAMIMSAAVFSAVRI